MARDVLGWRKLLGVVGPSTNTVVQPDFDDMRPRGVTNHYSRIYTPDADAVSDESFQSGISLIAGNTFEAVKAVITCKPDYIVMGMSAVTFFGGAKGAREWRERVEETANLQASVGSESLIAAFKAYGGIRKIAFLSPYYPSANAEVRKFFSDYGIESVRDVCLECPSWTAIAQVRKARLRQVILDIDGDDVDAVVQVGTNLSMVRLAAAAELFLGKPVIAINAATYWHALRACGIDDELDGFGRLLAEF